MTSPLMSTFFGCTGPACDSSSLRSNGSTRGCVLSFDDMDRPPPAPAESPDRAGVLAFPLLSTPGPAFSREIDGCRSLRVVRDLPCVRVDRCAAHVAGRHESGVSRREGGRYPGATAAGRTRCGGIATRE